MVTKLDPENQVIQAGEQRIDYDYLAIATGASFAFDLIPSTRRRKSFYHSKYGNPLFNYPFDF